MTHEPAPNPIVKASEPAWSMRLRAVVEHLRDTGYTFITPTPRTHALVNARPSAQVAKSLTDVFGWSRPFPSHLLSPSLLGALASADVLERLPSNLLRSQIRVSSLKDDLFIHSSYPTTAPDSVFFGPDTYKFSDAIETFLARLRGPITRAADICAGAGPGALTIARHAPRADVLMVDINRKALAYSAINALATGRLSVRPIFSDRLNQVSGAFDLVVAHPPYLVDARHRAYRHGGGLLGAELSLSILQNALPRLNAGGALLLFTGVAIVNGSDLFKMAVTSILSETDVDWSYREVDPDVFGEELEATAYAEADRIALIVLEVQRRGVAS